MTIRDEPLEPFWGMLQVWGGETPGRGPMRKQITWADLVNHWPFIRTIGRVQVEGVEDLAGDIIFGVVDILDVRGLRPIGKIDGEETAIRADTSGGPTRVWLVLS